jgi:DNA-directed RNA polymerase specialized sigma24 family protein
VDEILLDSVNTSPCYNIGIDQVETEETYQLLDKVILQLQASERELIMMRVYENMSWDEIARKFANRGEVISVTTLRQRGSRAMRSLRKIYQDQMRLLSKDV